MRPLLLDKSTTTRCAAVLTRLLTFSRVGSKSSHHHVRGVTRTIRQSPDTDGGAHNNNEELDVCAEALGSHFSQGLVFVERGQASSSLMSKDPSSLRNNASCRWLRAVAYNLLSATSACRLRKVSASLDADLIGLTGTRLLHYPGWCLEAPCFTARHEKHFEERCWYRDAQFSNGSAGVSILLNNKTWQAMHVKRVLDLGRGARERHGCDEGKTTSLQHHCGTRSLVAEPKKHTMTLHEMSHWRR